MSLESYIQITFWLALAGTVFAGYLSAHRLITKECAFNESCPYIFGIPACEIGFCLFLVMFAANLVARLGYLSSVTALDTIFYISLIGVLYAGTLSAKELIAEERTKSALILPTCAYGLMVFIALFGLSFAMVY